MTKRLRFLIVAASVMFACTASAQNFEPMPPGEGFQSVFEVHDGATSYFAGSTLHSIYKVTGLDGTSPSVVSLLRIPTPGILEIVPITGATGNTFLMLSRDGGVSKLHFANGTMDPPTILGHFPITANEAPIALAGGDNLYIVTTAGNIFVSRDNGATWASDKSGLTASIGDGGSAGFETNPVALDANQNVYIATSSGLYKQLKAGGPWASVVPTTSGLITVFVDKGNNIYAGGTLTYLTVSNAGTVSLTDTIGIGGFGAATIYAANNGEVYAYVTDTDYVANASLWRHDPVTKVWKYIDRPLSNQFALDSASGVPVNAAAFDVALVAANDYGLFVSSDHGTSWRAITGVLAEHATGFQKLSSGRKVVATKFGIFTRDPNDAAWIKRFPSTLYLRDLNLWQDKNGNLYSKDSEGFGIFRSIDNGTSWTYDTLGLGVFPDNIGDIGSAGFLVDENGNEHLSVATEAHSVVNYVKNTGGIWKSDTATYKPNDNAEIGAFYSDHHGFIYYLDRSDAITLVKRSIDGGAWSSVIGTIPAKKVFGVAFLNGLPVVATEHGLLSGVASWTQEPLIPQLKPDQTNAFALSIDSENIGWAAYGTTIDSENYSTTDLFRTKQSDWIPAGLQGFYFNSLESFGDTTYALTDAGIAKFVAHLPGFVRLSVNGLDFGTRDTNHTTTKTITVHNLSDRPVTVDSATITGPNKSNFLITQTPAVAPYVIPAGGSVDYTIQFFAGGLPVGQKNGMFTVRFGESTDSLRQATLTRISSTMVGVGESSLAHPLSVSIVPNPFHGQSKIRVNSETSTPIRVEVRDLLGRMIYGSESARTSAMGSHEFVFDADRLSLTSGMYYVTIFADTNQLTRQMMYLK
jgi:hypothetical protein